MAISTTSIVLLEDRLCMCYASTLSLYEYGRYHCMVGATLNTTYQWMELSQHEWM